MNFSNRIHNILCKKFLSGEVTPARYKFLQIYNDYYDNNDWINSEQRVKRDISGILYDD